MPKRVQIHRENKTKILSGRAKTREKNASPVEEAEADVDASARWVKLADQVLGNNIEINARKRP